MGIEFIAQYTLGGRKRKPFDFYFNHMGRDFLLEYDGQQHFTYVSHFHRDENHFHKRQRDDATKMRTAMRKGFRIIRIDHTQEAKIEVHLRAAFTVHAKVYLSSPEMYDYLGL